MPSSVKSFGRDSIFKRLPRDRGTVNKSAVVNKGVTVRFPLTGARAFAVLFPAILKSKQPAARVKKFPALRRNRAQMRFWAFCLAPCTLTPTCQPLPLRACPETDGPCFGRANDLLKLGRSTDVGRRRWLRAANSHPRHLLARRHRRRRTADNSPHWETHVCPEPRPPLRCLNRSTEWEGEAPAEPQAGGSGLLNGIAEIGPRR